MTHNYSTTKDGKEFIICMQKLAGPTYDGVTGLLIFSPDSKHIAYVAGRGHSVVNMKEFVIVDGKTGPALENNDRQRHNRLQP